MADIKPAMAPPVRRSARRSSTSTTPNYTNSAITASSASPAPALSASADVKPKVAKRGRPRKSAPASMDVKVEACADMIGAAGPGMLRGGGKEEEEGDEVLLPRRKRMKRVRGGTGASAVEVKQEVKQEMGSSMDQGIARSSQVNVPASSLPGIAMPSTMTSTIPSTIPSTLDPAISSAPQRYVPQAPSTAYTTTIPSGWQLVPIPTDQISTAQPYPGVSAMHHGAYPPGPSLPAQATYRPCPPYQHSIGPPYPSSSPVVLSYSSPINTKPTTPPITHSFSGHLDPYGAGPSTQLVSVKDVPASQKGVGMSDSKGSVEMVKPVKGKKKVKAPEGEKRLARCRENCPKNTQDRLHRVKTQRMYMVDRSPVPGVPNTETFKVLGSTGNVYSIVIGSNPTCNCPDCGKGNVPCKHIIFVFLKVLKVPESSTLWYQKGLLTNELAEIFAAAPDAVTGAAAPAAVRKAYLKATGAAVDQLEAAEAAEKEAGPSEPASNKKLDSLGEDCPVCYEEMSEDDDKKGKLVYDEVQGGCGKPLHKDCFNMWAKTATNKGDAVTCVWCRTPWPVTAAQTGKGKAKAGGTQYTASGYLNMADEAGMSRQRDTSSYYYGPRAGESLWTARYRYLDDY